MTATSGNRKEKFKQDKKQLRSGLKRLGDQPIEMKDDLPLGSQVVSNRFDSAHMNGAI